jgi:serine phosphatase RsbU (regulator of sigma subunit)
MFVTVWLGIVDLLTGKMQCANAGHEYPVLMRNGNYELVKDKHGLVLAAMEETRFREYELQMDPGDKLFVYTDGIPEAINSSEEQYSTDRLVNALNNIKDENMNATLLYVRQDIADFVGDADQFDDITMLGFTYFGTEA